MPQTKLALVRNEKIIKIFVPRGEDLVIELLPGERLVDIADQSWLRIGDYWGHDQTRWVNRPSA